MFAFKRKQIVILSLVLLILIAGYLQYSYKKSSSSDTASETLRLGESVFVENSQAPAADKNSQDKSDKIKDTKASKEALDIFAETKLNKEMTRSKAIAALKEITDDKNASKESKDKAYNERVQLESNSDKEMRIENLIKQKGYSDVIAIFGDDNSLNITVLTPTLNSSDVAKIVDIACRQANIGIEGIHIDNLY